MSIANILNTEALHTWADKLFRYRWLGIICYCLFLSPIFLLLPGILNFGDFMPDTISYQGDSVFELLLGGVITVILVSFTAAAFFRALTNRQYIWLIIMFLFFPVVLFYLLFGKTDRMRRE